MNYFTEKSNFDGVKSRHMVRNNPNFIQSFVAVY